MLWLIIKREFASNILTFRFMVGFTLCLVLIASSAYVLTKDYEQRLANYSDLAAKHKFIVFLGELSKPKVYSHLKVDVDRPPNVLSIVSEGFDKKLNSTVTVSHRDAPVMSGYTKDNPLLSYFSSIDISLIIQIVLSLLALLFSYNTISGEKERGTLTLTLSNSIPRSTLLLGKYIGGMLSITFLFVAGLLLGLMTMRLSPSVDFSSSDWARFLLIFLSSLVYISAFFLLGMLISSLTAKSATTLIFLLFIWVVSVVLLPNAATYIANHLKPVKSEAEIDSQKKNLYSDFLSKLEDYKKKHPPDILSYWYGSTDTGAGDVPEYIYFGPKETMLWHLEQIKFSEPLRLRYVDKVLEIYQRYYEDLKRQSSLASNISRLSPAWTYYNSTTILAGTDINNYLRFLDRTRTYQNELISYMRSKKAFSSLSYFTRWRESELPTAKELWEMPEEVAKAKYAKEGWKSVEPLDLSDMLVFELKSEDVASSIKRAMPDLLILALLNVIFFMGAYTAFMRADVR